MFRTAVATDLLSVGEIFEAPRAHYWHSVELVSQRMILVVDYYKRRPSRRQTRLHASFELIEKEGPEIERIEIAILISKARRGWEIKKVKQVWECMNRNDLNSWPLLYITDDGGAVPDSFQHLPKDLERVTLLYEMT